MATVPTLANRSGDFSDLPQNLRPLIPFTTATASPFAGTSFRQTVSTPSPSQALAYYPLPNQAGTATNANNYAGNSDERLDRNIFVTRLDHQFPSRISSPRATTSTTAPPTNRARTAIRPPTLCRHYRCAGPKYSFAYTHVFRSTLVNDLRVTYLRRKFIDTRPGHGDNLAAASASTASRRRLPGVHHPRLRNSGQPHSARADPDPRHPVLDSLSWFRGRHALKFGIEARPAATPKCATAGRRAISISPLITSLPGAAGTGNALASFLLGEVNAARS